MNHDRLLRLTNRFLRLTNIFNKLATAKLWYSGKSDISGKGAFANTKIDKGDNIGLGFEKIDDTGTPDKDYKRTNLGKLINHSKKPNLQLSKDSSKFYFITIKDIDDKEELTVDYKTFPWEGKRDFT